MQLISLGCAVVAAKYEEIYPPEISEYLNSCGNTKQEIVLAEINVSCFYVSGFFFKQ